MKPEHLIGLKAMQIFKETLLAHPRLDEDPRCVIATIYEALKRDLENPDPDPTPSHTARVKKIQQPLRRSA